MLTANNSASELPLPSPLAQNLPPLPQMSVSQMTQALGHITTMLEKRRVTKVATELGVQNVQRELLRHRWNPPKLYDKQKAALFTTSRYALCEASTKAGKTHGCIIWLAEMAMACSEGQSVWWIAPVQAQAKIAFRRMKRLLTEQGGKECFTATQSPMMIRLVENGALIEFKSAEKPDNLYGDDVYAAVIDEASRAREEAWHAVRSTLTATNGPVRMIGNVKGRRNWFYHMCRKAEAGAQDMHYAKLTAMDAVEGGVVKPEEIESAKRDLPEAVFNELYLAIPNDDGGNPFGLKNIAACAVAKLSTKPTVCFGIDLAKSYDFTVIIGLDEDGMPTYFDRFQKGWDDTEAEILRVIGDVPALIDSTGVGDPIVERLQKVRGNVEGFKFTASTKQQLMTTLQVAVQSKEVGILEGVMRMEMESFEYEYTRTGVKYTAPPGLHDDCVMALALARAKLTRGDAVAGFAAYYASEAQALEEKKQLNTNPQAMAQNQSTSADACVAAMGIA